MGSRHAEPVSKPPLVVLAALLYALLLIYGTLFPLRGWTDPGTSPLNLMLANGLRGHASWADLVTNLLVYMPLGFLVMYGLPLLPRCRWCKWLLVTLAGALLSFTLEYLQAWIPGRTTSVLDLVLNTAGTGGGALAALLLRRGSRAERRFQHLRNTYIRSGATANLGLTVLGLWALAQLAPLVPSLDLDNLRNGVKPLWFFVQDPSRFSWLKWGEYVTALVALGLLYVDLQRHRYRAVSRFLLFAGLVLALKVPVVTRQLAPESLFGLATATILLPFLARTGHATFRITAFTLVLFTMLLEAIQPGSGVSRSFNWIPFQGHLSNNIIGMLDILAGAWPPLALAYLSRQLFGVSRRVIVAGTLGLFAGTFVLELAQKSLPGRSADITDVVVATLAWLFAWIYLERNSKATEKARASSATKRKGTLAMALAAGVLTSTIAIGFFFSSIQPPEAPRDDRMLPEPSAMPPLRLAQFRMLHPRLPAPSPDDLDKLREENPRYLRSRKHSAKGGKGRLEDVIFTAFVEPGSQDMSLLFSRLMKLKMNWRGHQQAKPLALAYDWLYDQWTPAQRRALARRVVEASEYLIELIRKDQLSPYNVYLYNSPLQALVATSIAAWQDLPEADAPMRWTADYLRNHLLPVWRQIMGTNGGWHEGGEYVGIGIGQAIYQIPAMWRRATGEDLFASEPGIRGFADFLVYRTRPDRTHMRWGDGRFFDKAVPDRLALAMETDNRASYSLLCPRKVRPTSWPWGPLSDDRFCDPDARKKLPLEKRFDGLGQVIARSDWGPDATWVSFKAGDNYWSHIHLDQGAFTLYKGGPLAIDSGYYGPGYDSDHRYNYSVQTIAHNVITITDPKDTRPLPPRKEGKPPRHIANDGGQRRVGSGWGKRAPLDLAEWQEERETYHTGRIAKYLAEDDLVVAVAELTPAYTNSRSGAGTFADRTFRVRHYWRTFLYDRRNDLVVIHDDVTAADPSLRKRSLVHTLERPELTPGGFSVSTTTRKTDTTPPASRAHMEAWVLFPKNARIRLVGGKDREFWVDGENYDAGGRIWERIAKRKKNPPQPGRWRVEIKPDARHARDQFLMVLAPGERQSLPTVEALQEGNFIGTRIATPRRTLELHYPNDREGVLIQLKDPERRRTIDLTLPRAAELEPPGFWTRMLQWLR